MKVIFLDFDGVLNSQQYFMARSEKIEEFRLINYNKRTDIPVMLERQMLDIDLHNLENLIKIIKKTHAIVVVTSSWKVLTIFPLLAERLGHLGVPIIGVTDDDGINRGLGIKTFLETHDINNYIILDDDIFPDYDDELLEHLIKTSFYENGLTKELMLEAIDKLKDKKILIKKR